MFVHHRSPSLIIKKEDRGESDQLFTVYARDFGKLKIFSKAIRKISSKLRSGAEIFYLSEVEFIQAKNRKTLTDAVLIKKFKNINGDLSRFKIACQISKITDDLTRGQEKDAKIWDLLTEVFKKLNNQQFLAENLFLIYHYFLWNFLFILGYKLNLHNCSFCRKEITPEMTYFYPKAGGIICAACFKKHRGGREIEPEIIKILRLFFKKDTDSLSKIKIKPGYLKSLENVSKDYLACVFAMTR